MGEFYGMLIISHLRKLKKMNKASRIHGTISKNCGVLGEKTGQKKYFKK